MKFEFELSTKIFNNIGFFGIIY